MMRYLLVAFSFLFFTACAFNPQNAYLNPVLNVSSDTVGSGVSVNVSVVDERPTQSLGNRGSGYGPAAEIRSTQDIAALVEYTVTEGLAKKGFDINESGNSLKVEVRLLEYKPTVGLVTGGILLRSALKAYATSSQGESFEKMYRSEDEKRVVVVPTADKNNEYISQILSDSISKMVNDPELLTVLSK